MARSAGRDIIIRGGHILSCDADIGDRPSGDILISAGRIVEIAPRIESADAEIVDATDRIVMPGFIDSHRHLWEGVLRNSLPDAGLGEYFQQVLGTFGPQFTPEDVYVGQTVSVLGALNAGVTTLLDWSHIQNTPEHTDAALQALTDSRIRAVFAYAPPSRGFIPWHEDPGHAYPEDLRRLRKGRLSSDDGRVTLGLGAIGPGAQPDDAALREWRVAEDLGVRIAVHAGVGTFAPLGAYERFAKIRPLYQRTTYIHCCNLSDADWQLIADTGGSVSISPQIELQMGHGMPPIQKALRLGLMPSLSVDVETSAPGDMFTQMRSALALRSGLDLREITHAMKESPKIGARDILHWATIGGARANGLDDRTGSLTPGKQADLQLLRTDMINVLPINDPYGAVVTGMDTSNVCSVMVGGQWVKRHGSLIDVDLAAVRRLAEAARDRIYSAVGAATAEANAAAAQAGAGAHDHAHH